MSLARPRHAPVTWVVKRNQDGVSEQWALSSQNTHG
uniref:Uncharacterized protein n=1 Tax=Anguilla anguilla TaxID=7936 RepID=A0A0E9XLF0_ANGAN